MGRPDLPRKEASRHVDKLQPLDRAPRLQRLTQLMTTQGVDGVLLSQPANIEYFTGFKAVEPMEREAFAFVGTDGRKDFVTRQLYFGQTPDGFTPMDILDLPTHLKQLQQSGIATVGIEEDNLTVAEHKLLLAAGVQTKGVEPKELRVAKTEEEIDRIRESCRLGDLTFTYMLSQIKEGLTESQLRDILEQHMRSQGISAAAFPTIVAIGENGANPHQMPDNTPLTKNNFITFDFGFVGLDGYQSDMTRTVFFGQPTEEDQKMYSTVLTAQEAVITHLQDAFGQNPEAELVARDVDGVARQIILDAGYLPEHFPHGTGHGIGIETHEPPFLNARSSETIKAGMVFSDEPGVYVPGKGGVRIEDLIAVHPDGKVEVLTHSPKELLVIPA
ncbi:MAG TPA: Xaa-Pro peptidase family protein [Candidatus Eisenbacteria bacterium]|nr:Xaa-Pro peptidase family protein [Candidatus Eisenbacteria bacterium]